MHTSAVETDMQLHQQPVAVLALDINAVRSADNRVVLSEDPASGQERIREDG